VVTVAQPVKRVTTSRTAIIAEAQAQDDLRLRENNGKKEVEPTCNYAVDLLAFLAIGPDEIHVDENPAVVFKLGDPEIGTTAEPDPGQVYYVELRGKTFEQRNFVAEFDERGLLTSADSTVTDKTAEVAVTVFEKAAGVAGTFLGKAASAAATTTRPVNPGNKPYKHVIEQVIEIRRARREALSRAGNVSPEALAKLLDAIDGQEAALIELLTGAKRVESLTLRYAFRPTPVGLDAAGKPSIPAKLSAELFTFDPVGGLVSLMPDQQRIPTGWARGGGVPRTYSVDVAYDPDPAEQFSSVVSTPNSEDRSYAYRIPARVLVRVRRSAEGGADEVARKGCAVAQLGTVVTLPVGLGGTASQFKPALFTDTGGLKGITVSTTPIDPALVGRAGAAAGEVVTAAHDQELNRLRREKEMAELRKAIRDAQPTASASGDSN
jgi:hypothetical protein